jgi:hypothetical protein
MSKRSNDNSLSRRSFVRLAGQATAAVVGMGILPMPFKRLMGPLGVSEAQAAVTDPPDLFFAGTDGWISLPSSPAIFSASLGGIQTHPDSLAPISLAFVTSPG